MTRHWSIDPWKALMVTSNPRPKWWQLYLTLPLFVALFVIEHRLNLSTHGHQAVQIGIVVLVYGLIHFWLRANSTALSGMDREQYYEGFSVIRIPPSRLPKSNGEDIQILHFPASEIQGMLSDTFEMDYIDAVSLPVDEVSEESKKE